MSPTLPRLALSVRQPWAWAIMHGGKDIENRVWRRPNPALAFRGPVAIHAASGMTQDEYYGAADMIRRIVGDAPAPHELVRGCIIGTVDVTDMVRESTSPWFMGPLGLVLANATPCAPIPVIGNLGFFPWQPIDGGAPVPPAKWMLPKLEVAKCDLKTAPENGELPL